MDTEYHNSAHTVFTSWRLLLLLLVLNIRHSYFFKIYGKKTNPIPVTIIPNFSFYDDKS